MIEWMGCLINPAEVEAVYFDTHYASVYDVRDGTGTECAYIYMRHRQAPIRIACRKSEYETLKSILTHPKETKGEREL